MSAVTYDLGARFRWHWYYQVTRRRQRFAPWLVRRMPRWVKYWAFIEVTAEVTASPAFSRRVVPEVTAMEVLEAYRRG